MTRGERWLVTDTRGKFVSIVGPELAGELDGGDMASPELVVTKLPLDHPFPGSVPYPLTAETAELLLGPRR